MVIPKQTIDGRFLTRLNPATTIHLEKIILDNSIKKIIEIGSFTGMGSTQLFNKYCDEIVCIDDFSEKETFEIMLDNKIEKFNQLELFNLVIKNSKKIKVFNMSSDLAHKLLQDNYYDAVFIDGSHYYQNVFNDIKNYYYKTKNKRKTGGGGLIFGDDCQGYLSQFNKNLIIKNLDQSCVDIKNFKYSQIHPGSIMAIHDLLKYVKFEKKKIINNKIDYGYSWLWQYKRSYFGDLNFELRKKLIKFKMKSSNNFRNKYIKL